MSIKNAERFVPPERERWRLIAAGQSPVVSGKPKRPQWTALSDEAGYVIRSGGILMPREWDMPTGHYYYRFVDSSNFSKHETHGAANHALFGGWWISYEVIKMMVDFAQAQGDLLENVASYFLALPLEWGDRARLVRACLGSQLRAWRGRGLPAQSTSGKYIPPQHLHEILQCFIPGDAAQRAAAFLPLDRSSNIIYTRDSKDAVWFK